MAWNVLKLANVSSLASLRPDRPVHRLVRVLGGHVARKLGWPGVRARALRAWELVMLSWLWPGSEQLHEQGREQRQDEHQGHERDDGCEVGHAALPASHALMTRGSARKRRTGALTAGTVTPNARAVAAREKPPSSTSHTA